MVLKLVDTRVEKNSKCEMYAGVHGGHILEGVKIYSRVTMHHQFKFVKELYRCDLSEESFHSINPIKDLIESSIG